MPRDKSSLMGRTMNETPFDSKTETRPMGISGRLSGGPAAHLSSLVWEQIEALHPWFVPAASA